MLHRTLLRNWWALAFILMTWAFYLQAIHKKNKISIALEEKVAELTLAREMARKTKEELLLRMQSYDDLDFLELVLKEKLGVIGEQERKVVFQ